MKTIGKKLLSAVLAAAILVGGGGGFLTPSAQAAHTDGETLTNGIPLQKTARIYINQEDENDPLLPENNSDSLMQNAYSYVIPLTQEQANGVGTIEFDAKAEVAMSEFTANQLMGNTLDISKTKFMVFMALGENLEISEENTGLLFNSTFLMPDEAEMQEMDANVTVEKDTSYSSAYTSETALDMRWKISGDIEGLRIPNAYPNENGQDAATTTTAALSYNTFQLSDWMKERAYLEKFGYTDGAYANTGGQIDDEWITFQMGGKVMPNARLYNVNIYAIPVKLNWSALVDAVKDGTYAFVDGYTYQADDENTQNGDKIYDRYTVSDWTAPMYLSAEQTGDTSGNARGVKLSIDLANLKVGEVANRGNAWMGTEGEKASPHNFIPTATDSNTVRKVDAIPISGTIGGGIWFYHQDGETGELVSDSSPNYTHAFTTGTILTQFSLPVTGNIEVKKTIQVQDDVTLTDDQKAALADLSDTPLGITVTNADGQEVADSNALTLSWDETAQTLTATGTITGLSSDTTYDVSVDAEDAAALEEADLYLQDGIQVSGGEDIDLTDYYQLTRNEDGTVNTSGLIEEGKVPTVTVTSTYGTEKPATPTVTLTYDPNGGDGPDNEFTQDLVDGKAEFTVIENPFTRDEVNGVTYSFTGWNTRADGTGTDYAPDSTITLTEDETLYAQWKAEGEEPPVETSDTVLSKTLSGNLDENGETNVTLSVPSDGYKQTVDVVLAVDCTSVLEHYGNAIIENIGTLGDELLEEDVNLSVGVVAFGRESKVVHELTALNQGNSEHWASDIAADIWENQDWYLSNEGTNIQGGIRMAQDVLNRSTSGADANHKYIVLITDGGAYWYCRSDTDDTPVNTAHKGDKLQSMGNMDANGDVGSHQNDSAYLRHVEAGGDFASFMEQYGTQIEESAAGKAFSLEETMAAQEAGSATEDPALKEVWDNAFTTEQVNDPSAYPFLNMERGTYFAAQELLNAKEQGTHIVTIGYPYTAGILLESLRTVSADFREWTGTVGDYYDGNNLGNAFSDLADQITYFVDAGSYVIDQMGSGEDQGWKYDFDFVNDAQYLTLTVGGETLKVTDLGNNSYGFGDSNGSADGKNYPFVLTYSPGENSNDSFRLNINVPVLASEPVQLTYRVKQVNEEDGNTHGQYDPDGSQNSTGLFTNSNATLYPKDGPAMEFPKPTVSVGAIRIQPADITIYTGGDGYESVVTGSGDSQVGTASDGLPEPGFYVELPAALNQFMINNANQEDVREVEITDEDGTVTTQKVVDLSAYLSFTYKDDQGNTRLWKLERYDKQTGNDSMAYSRYIYRILPAVVGDETIPIRLQFEAPDGTLTTSDDFTIHLDGLFQEYGMSIYPGALNQDMVKAQITLNETKTDYDTVVDKGKLTVRGVTDQNTITTEVVKGDAPADEVEDITAHVPGDTQFYINESQLEVADPSKVELLVDSIVPDENNTLQNSAISQFDEITSSQQVQLNYLDLVDTSNGNAWVTASEPITVYWPYPEGTDQNDTFYIVHYEDLDRNDNDALAADDYTMELYSADQGNLENTPQGIKITVESFSPFALFWGETGDPDWPPVDPITPIRPPVDPDKPELNTEDHYAYIVGYPDGNVKPEGNITRAEVATIFFRLLTDESRDEFWSQTNPYSDVSEDDWYNNAVSTLTNAGIIDGYEDGTFKPNGNITRAEFATIAVRFFEATYEGENLFPDIAGHWAQDYINEAANAGIVDGYPDGTFGPQKLITRAEAMTMVNRTIDRHPHEDHLLADMIVWPDNPETAWYYEQVQEATNSHEYTMNTDDEQNPYEIWTELLPVRDWAQLEKEWSDAHSGQSGGDVV